MASKKLCEPNKRVTMVSLSITSRFGARRSTPPMSKHTFLCLSALLQLRNGTSVASSNTQNATIEISSTHHHVRNLDAAN